MKLSIVIPTYNRAESLKKTLSSLAKAEIPPNFDVEITVVDNNSTDGTRAVVEEMIPLFSSAKLEYLFEVKQGRSFAVNAGIKKADGELFSAVDDDEEIEANWFVEIEKIFRERWETLDFVGGKILPNWETEPPDWIEPLKAGVICWRDFGDEEWVYDWHTPTLTGGHGIFKTDVFKEIGLYEENVGAKGKGFISGEDDVLYHRLLKKKKHGVYNPKLVIYHYVPAYRLNKNYYRQWLFGVGISRYLADLYDAPFEGAKLFGVPRWMYKTALDGVAGKIKYIVGRNETESLAAENQPLVFAGYFYGRHLQDTWADKIFQSIFGKMFKTTTR